MVGIEVEIGITLNAMVGVGVIKTIECHGDKNSSNQDQPKTDEKKKSECNLN